jgi:hypothetical protein
MVADQGTGAGWNRQGQQLNPATELAQLFQIDLLQRPALAGDHRQPALAQELLGLVPAGDLADQIAPHHKHRIGPGPEPLGSGHGFDRPGAAELLL